MVSAHRGLPYGGRAGDLPGQASPRQVLGMLAWHAANMVPVLDIPHSLEWHRPARSASAVVGASILALRLWVAIGVLAVLKRL